MFKVLWNWGRQAFWEPSGILIICWGEYGRGGGGCWVVREQCHCPCCTMLPLLPTLPEDCQWQFALCWVKAGSGMKSCVLFSLQRSHALISLQSQPRQQGLHNPWYTVTEWPPKPGFSPRQSWWDYKQLASHTKICQMRCLIGPQDQYFVQDSTRSNFFLAMFSCSGQMCLYHSSQTTRINYSWY